MAKTIPNFGQIVMASRQGWKWSPEIRLFVRIKSVAGLHKVEIQPSTFKPDPAPFSVDLDWQAQEGALSMIPALNKYMGRTKPCMFYMNDDGEEMTNVVWGEIPAGEYRAGQIIPIETKPFVIEDSKPKPVIHTDIDLGKDPLPPSSPETGEEEIPAALTGE